MPDDPEPQAPRDELVVDLQQWPVIEAMLTDLGIGYNPQVENDDGLGLARLTDLEDDTDVPIDLDELLAELRNRFAAQRQGLLPMLGKNRFVDTIIGAGHKIMAGGVPQVATEQDYLRALDVDAAGSGAEHAGSGQGVRVGIVDTRMPFAAINALGDITVDVAPDVQPLKYKAGHSTFVADLIRRQAPKASLHLAGVLDDDGRADSWVTARAMMRLANEKQIDIMNLSLGCYAATGPPFVITRAIERLTPRVLVVAAAGNHGEFVHWERGRTRESANWPAALTEAVAVGADSGPGTDPATFSPRLPWVRFTALGVDVIGRYLDGPVDVMGTTEEFHGYATWSGTSFAAATVSGAIAARYRPGSVPTVQGLTQLLEGSAVVRPYPGGLSARA